MNTKTTSRVAHLAANLDMTRKGGRFTAAQIEAMRAEDASAPQIELLAKLGFTSKETMNKADAAELIDTLIAKRDVARSKPGSITSAQTAGLIKWGYTADQLDGLSFNEASELMEVTAAKAKAAKQEEAVTPVTTGDDIPF